MRVPERSCVVCKKVMDKKALLRIVKNAAGEISLDLTGRKNGRGAYLCTDEACLLKLQKTKGLDRSFKMQLSGETYDKLIEEIRTFRKG